MKRLFDVVASGLLLVLLSPVLAVVAVIVRLDSRGPVFFRGVRTGRHGKPFKIIKFRTMVPDAERLGGPCAATDDPRVTGVGRLLRRTKLDELPQLVNVLLGDMSIVGPRPEVPEYTEKYPEERLIVSVRPGITDWASIAFINQADLVSGDDPRRDYEERVRPLKTALRVRYVREHGFLTDLGIIVATATAIVRVLFFRGRGGPPLRTSGTPGGEGDGGGGE